MRYNESPMLHNYLHKNEHIIFQWQEHILENWEVSQK